MIAECMTYTAAKRGLGGVLLAGGFLNASGSPESLAVAEMVTGACLGLFSCFVDEFLLIDADVTSGDSIVHELLATLAPVT